MVLKETYAVKGNYTIIKAKVADIEGAPIFDDDTVKFTSTARSTTEALMKRHCNSKSQDEQEGKLQLFSNLHGRRKP